MTQGQRAARARTTTSSIDRLAEAKEELFNLRFQHATGQLDNTARHHAACEREIARIAHGAA